MGTVTSDGAWFLAGCVFGSVGTLGLLFVAFELWAIGEAVAGRLKR